MNTTLRAFALALLVGLAVIPASAELITFEIGGTIGPVPSELAGAFAPGDPFTITYTFESTTPDAIPGKKQGIYTGAITELSAQVGAYTAEASSGDIEIFDNFSGFIDRYLVFTGDMTGPPVNGLAPDNVLIIMGTVTSKPFNSDKLPTTPPTPADFSERLMTLRFGPGGSIGVSSVIQYTVRVGQFCDLVAEPGDLIEPESCGEDTNGGCNSDPPAFTPIACGQTYFGTAWAENSTRDTDWYRFELFETTAVTVTLESEFDGVSFILAGVEDDACDAVELEAGGSLLCESIPLTITLNPGLYVGWVGTGNANTGAGIFGGRPCGENNDYRLTLSWADCDSDGVNLGDVCPDTAIPEGVPTKQLGVNRWALTDADFEFDTKLPPGGGNGPGFSFSTADTAGCSCEQIIEILDLGLGHEKFGCSNSAMLDWNAIVRPGGGVPLNLEAQGSQGGMNLLQDDAQATKQPFHQPSSERASARSRQSTTMRSIPAREVGTADLFLSILNSSLTDVTVRERARGRLIGMLAEGGDRSTRLRIIHVLLEQTDAAFDGLLREHLRRVRLEALAADETALVEEADRLIGSMSRNSE
jgi:hypothetical protein